MTAKHNKQSSREAHSPAPGSRAAMMLDGVAECARRALTALIGMFPKALAPFILAASVFATACAEPSVQPEPAPEPTTVVVVADEITQTGVVWDHGVNQVMMCIASICTQLPGSGYPDIVAWMVFADGSARVLEPIRADARDSTAFCRNNIVCEFSLGGAGGVGAVGSAGFCLVALDKDVGLGEAMRKLTKGELGTEYDYVAAACFDGRGPARDGDAERLKDAAREFMRAHHVANMPPRIAVAERDACLEEVCISPIEFRSAGSIRFKSDDW